MVDKILNSESINIEQYFDKNNFYYNLWDEKLTKNEFPKYINKVKILDYKYFEKEVLSQNINFGKDLIQSLMDGDIYILKKAYDAKYLIDLKKKAINLIQNSESTFHKIYENCPNFYREINEDLAKNYSFKIIKDSLYFFPWNDDFNNLYKETYKRWRLLKYISGYYNDCWENNTPKDGIVDRIQIVKYPAHSGRAELHQDPHTYQKFFISVYMSKRNIDYKEGGMYLLDINKNEIEIENNIDIGDLAFGCASILHGVKRTYPIKENDIDDALKGRWWMGLYSTVSDYVKNRHTGKPANIK